MTQKKDLTRFSSEKDLESSSSFLDELHESMTGILQDLFESQQEILSFSEEHPIIPSPVISPCEMQKEAAVMQKDLEALQNLCCNLLQKMGTEPLSSPPSQDLANHQLIPLQEHLQKSWEKLQDIAPVQELAANLQYEVSEMQKWIHVALKQVEKSLDLMERIPPKYL